MGIKKYIFLMLFILILPVFAAGDGCCIYEDALFDWAICQKVPEQLCCGDSENCEFEADTNCYSAGGVSNFDECDRGCCCVDHDDSDEVLATITTRAACSGDFEDEPSLVESSQACADYCGGDSEDYSQITGEQCVYYYCGGDTVPEGPIPDEHSLNLQYTSSIFSGFDGKVTAAVETADHYWLVNDNRKLFLFDSSGNLVPESQLDDFEMDENPSNVSVLHEDLYNINSMADVSSNPGIIFLGKGDDIYKFTDSGLTSYTTGSQLGYMTSYGSYNFGSYLFFHGSGDSINYFQTDSRSNPFNNKANQGSFDSVLDDIDAILELNFDNNLPCILIFGGCRAFSGCENDSHCVDFNECTEGECDGGECHFPALDDGISCGPEDEGQCCGGVCYTEGINYDFHESCRTGPSCDDTFLKYESGNEDSLCEGDCFVCNEGDCDARDHDLCEEGEYCNEEGECVEPEDECSEEGETRCHPDSDDKIQECYEDDELIEGESYFIWEDPVECSSEQCEEAICVDGECDTENTSSGEADHDDDDGCFNHEHCDVDEGGVCRCDGEGECDAWCDDQSDCDYLDDTCKAGVCDTETGVCSVDNLDEGTCTTSDGNPGYCVEGDCVEHSCTEDTIEDDCPPAPECEYTICDEDNLCDVEDLDEGESCEVEGAYPGECDGEGNCDFINCDPDKDPEDEGCPSGDCTNPICPEGVCEKDDREDGIECELEDGEEGFCYGGDCVECYLQDQCDSNVCFDNFCVDCVNPGDCEENDICDDYECVTDCRVDDSVCGDDYCDEDTGECVKCLEGGGHCDDDDEVCHQGECVDECDDETDCSDNDVCVEGACVDCENHNDCQGDNNYCNVDKNECAYCTDNDHCGDDEHCYQYVCIDNCANDDHCPGDNVCNEETGECLITCSEGDECPGDDVCDEDTGVCVDCTESGDCDDGNECTINECDTETNTCIEENEDLGTECELSDGEDGFCNEGDCVEGCTDSDDCGEGVTNNKDYCYELQGSDMGVCVECYEKEHCDIDDEFFMECREVEECVISSDTTECIYNETTGNDCISCDSDLEQCICFHGDCVVKCDENNEDEVCGDEEFCTEEGICVECDEDNPCDDDGNDCTKTFCDNGVCKTENEDDIETTCGDNNEGYCCSGDCVTDVKGDDFDNNCTDWDMACNEATGEVEFEYTNQGELCDDSACSVCNYGYCDDDDDSYCNDGQDCVSGECLDGCQNKCEPGDSECMDGVWARIKECTDHPNIDDCYTWDTPEKCPGDKCEEPYCSDGDCGLNPVPSGDSDEDCWNGFGCDGEICRCDGLGYCIALECDTDSDCEDEELPCMDGTCVGGECEYEPKEDGTKLEGGVCCGGALQIKTGNNDFNESCRSDTPQCVGGSYEFVAENDGESCAGECAVCNDGTCHDNSSLCSQGEECENGECVGCKNSCTEGETRCVGTGVQVCEEINGCMTWGEIESCDDDGMCTQADCMNGECVVINVEKGETDSDCYSLNGCDGENCACDGDGHCVSGEEKGPVLVSDNKSNGENGNGDSPGPKNGDDGENGRVGDEEGMNLWWLMLLIILMVVVIGGFTGAYYYDANYNQGRAFQNINKFFENLKNKLNNLFSKSKKSGSPQAMNKPAQGPIRSGSSFYNGQRQSQPGAASPGQIKPQSPTQAGLSKGQGQQTQAQGKPDTALQKEIYNYLQTLRKKGPDRDKEVELLKKGVSTQKIKELYQMVRKENEKRAERNKKMAKFD